MVLHVFVCLLVACLQLSLVLLGVMTGSISGLPPHEEGPSAAHSPVC